MEVMGIEFFKTRPARLLIEKMGGAKPEAIAIVKTIERFERLFGALNKRLDKVVAKRSEPFS